MEKILTFIRSISKDINNYFAVYYWVSDGNSKLDIYRKSPIFPRKRSIPFDMVKSIYVIEIEFHFCLELYTNDNKKLFLWQPRYENDPMGVKNWEELIDIIQKKYLDFNWNNFNLTNEVFSVPILCWHSEKAVPDLQVMTTEEVISVVYKESGQGYVFDDYLSLFKTSKHVI